MQHRPSTPLAALLSIWALLFVQPAQAQQKTWKNIGDWTILASASGQCAAVVDWPGERYLVLSWVEEADGSMLTFGARGWRSIASDRTYNVVLHLPPAPPMAVAATGLREGASDGRPMLLVAAEGRALLDNVARAAALEVEYKGEIIARFELAGSSAAIAGMIECQRLGGRQPPAGQTPPPAAAPRAPAPSLLPPQSGPAREAPSPNETSPLR